VLIRNQRLLSVVMARNLGVFHATGEWVGLCDNDDLRHPRRIELVLQAAARRPEARAVSTGATCFALASERARLDGHQRGRMVEHWVPVGSAEVLAKEVGEIVRPAEREITFADLQFGTCFVTTQVCFRREAYALAGGNAPWCYRGDDWVLNASASLLAPILRLEAPFLLSDPGWLGVAQ